MKECFAITSYCDTEEKIEILNKTINNLKQYNIDIMVHAHYPVDVQNNVNFYFYSSDNPILYNRWNYCNYFSNDHILEMKMYDFSYTVLKGWSEIINILCDYDKIHFINYDTNLTTYIFELSKKYDKSIFLKNVKNDCYNLLYFCLKHESFDFFKNNIKLQDWLNFTPNHTNIPIAEEYIPTFTSGDEFLKINYDDYDHLELVRNNVSSDNNLYHDDLYKFLTLENNKIMIGNYNNNLGILFFDVKKEIITEIFIDNDIVHSIVITNDYFFNIEIPKDNFNKLKIKINNQFINNDLIKRFIYHDSIIWKK